jgi:hypothetical protein
VGWSPRRCQGNPRCLQQLPLLAGSPTYEFFNQCNSGSLRTVCLFEPPPPSCAFHATRPVWEGFKQRACPAELSTYLSCSRQSAIEAVLARRRVYQAKAGAARKARCVNNSGSMSALWAFEPLPRSAEMRKGAHQRDCELMAAPVDDHRFIRNGSEPTWQAHAPAGFS